METITRPTLDSPGTNSHAPSDTDASYTSHPTFMQALRFWLKLGFISFGAPYIEKLRGNLKLTSALSSITAAVVGVVLNLAVWFGVQVLIPSETGFNWFGAILGTATFVAIQWGELGIITIILGAAGVGLCRYLAVIALS